MISMTFTGPPSVKSCRFLQSRPRQSRRVDSEEFRFVASLGWRNKEAAFNDQSVPPTAGSRLIGDGPSVPRGSIARCNKGGNAPYHLGLSQQGRVTLIRHDDDFKLFAPCQHLIQGGPSQHI
jgi:hypothetical protein